MNQREITAAIYCRLSRDDGGDTESNSIGTQRDMLQEYAQNQGFLVYNEYVDDGWSGTNFERPSFKRLVEDIEAGFIGAVLVKDLSRLGRNNALVAYYTEMFFPDNSVRLIALNDSIDTGKGDNEIMAFKSVINEYYARDISKKIRSSRRIQAIKGEYYGAFAPYGYIKNPDNRRKLIVDEEAAEVVRTMFNMAADGLGTYQIARRLTEARILVPSAYKFQKYGQKEHKFDENFPYDWNQATVRNFLISRIYLGTVVSHKQSTKSFKNKKMVRHPVSDWIAVENMHEGIIDPDQFERVQRQMTFKNRENSMKKLNLFAGILTCADCGSRLNFHASTQSKGKEGRFLCNRYRHSNMSATERKCTIHSVAYRTMYDLTLDRLNSVISANLTEDEVVERIGRNRAADNLAEKKLAKMRQRENELRTIIRKIVEQNALGDITPTTFADLYGGYKAEQDSLYAKIRAMEQETAAEDRDRGNARKFLEAVRKYTVARELTREMLLDLIETIIVHEATGDSRKRTREQVIDFHYRFAGKLD